MRLIIFFALQNISFAQIPITAQSIQLQQLINKSEAQVLVLKKLLQSSQVTEDSIVKANQILEKLSDGLDQSIEKFQGTEAYQKALLEIQSKTDYQKRQGSETMTDGDYKKLAKFQDESVKANISDLESQQKLQQALQTAHQGFVPKIQAQAQLGSWQANTRVSAQMTELLASIQAMREELRALRKQRESEGPLTVFLKGAEMQNQKQKEIRLQ